MLAEAQALTRWRARGPSCGSRERPTVYAVMATEQRPRGSERRDCLGQSGHDPACLEYLLRVQDWPEDVPVVKVSWDGDAVPGVPRKVRNYIQQSGSSRTAAGGVVPTGASSAAAWAKWQLAMTIAVVPLAAVDPGVAANVSQIIHNGRALPLPHHSPLCPPRPAGRRTMLGQVYAI